MARKQSASARNVQTVTRQLMQRFESGDISECVSAALIQRKQGDKHAPSAKWSWNNVVLMLMSGTSDARGYRQWQDVGRHVKQGSKAIHILAPRTVKKTETDETTGQETERAVVIGFTTVPVFRFEDTDGEPLPTFDYRPVELPPFYHVASAFGIPVNYCPSPSNPRWLGRYSRSGSGEQIHLITQDVSTFLHELAHAAHARVLKSQGKTMKGGQDAKQEAVAELAATVLAQMYGYDYSGNCWQYVKAYAKDGDALRLMLRVLNDVCEVSDLILRTDDRAAMETATAA